MKILIYLFILFLIGCNNKKDNNTPKTNIQKDINKTKSKTQKTIIQIDDINFSKKNSISYDFKTKKMLVFIDNSKNSKLQIKEINKSKQKFYIIKNKDLIKHFKIKSFPTILIVDNNSTKRYEGFIPYEILKYEIKE
jgi:thioredoxin-related protein